MGHFFGTPCRALFSPQLYTSVQLGSLGLGSPLKADLKGFLLSGNQTKPQFIVWKKHTGDLKSEHSIEQNYFDPVADLAKSTAL